MHLHCICTQSLSPVLQIGLLGSPLFMQNSFTYPSRAIEYSIDLVDEDF